MASASEADIPSSPTALSIRDVGFFLSNRFLWVSANQITNVGVGWLVYAETRSALALGLVGLAAFAPKVLLTLLAGVVVDRYDRRLVMGLCLAVSGAVNLGLLAIAIAADVNVNAIYVLFILLGISRSFIAPSSQALIASLVPREHLSRVVGLSSSTGQFATILGPALGGLLYIVGPGAAFACAAIFYFAAVVLILMIRRPTQQRAKGPVTLGDAFAGLAFIRRRPVILGAISLDMFSVLLGGATALLPIVASDILHVGPFGLGLLRSAPAVGAMMLGLTLAYLPIQRRAGVKLLGATTVFGLATIALGLSSSFVLSLAILWLIGASDVFSVVIRQTLVQSDTPDSMRGRVAAVNSLFIGASNELGEFESGLTAHWFGLVPAILIGGVGTIAVSALWAVVFPGLRTRDRLVEPETSATATA